MATAAKNASSGKVKTRSYPSTPQHIDLSNGRKTPKTSVTASTVKCLSLLSGKASPHYQKPTISSSNEVCKYGQRQVADNSSIKTSLRRRKSYKKPLSSYQLQRSVSASPRIGILKPSSPPPKVAQSPKPILEIASRTTRIVKSKPESTTRRMRTTTKKETKGNSLSTTTSPTSLEVSKIQKIKVAQEDKATLDQEVEQETIKVVDKEEIGPEIPTILDETLIDPIDSGTKSLEDEMTNASNSSTLLEKQDLEPETPLVLVETSIDAIDSLTKGLENEKINASNSLTLLEERVLEIGTAPHTDEVDNGNHHEDEEESNENKEDCSEHTEPEVEVKLGEENTLENTRTCKGNVTCMDDSNDENTPYKLRFRKGKEIEEKEDENGGSERLKFKEREGYEDGDDDGKEEKENVVLKRRDVQGKKESSIYNDMIKETVSKLVEKRKSKVKALVGAFETVISLHEEGQTN